MQVPTEREARVHENKASDLIMERIIEKSPRAVVATSIDEHPLEREARIVARDQQEQGLLLADPRPEGKLRQHNEDVAAKLWWDDMMRRQIVGMTTLGIGTKLKLFKTALKWFGIGSVAGDVLDPLEKVDISFDVNLPAQPAPRAPIDGAINASMVGFVTPLPFFQQTHVAINYMGDALGIVSDDCWKGIIEGMTTKARNRIRGLILRKDL